LRLVPVLRWLLPLVAALALVGQSLTAWAAAGSFGDPTCCCPQPKKCKCHDHGDSKSDAELRRCTGGAKLVAPAPLIAEPPAVPEVACEVAVARVALPPPPALSTSRPEPPEPPPF
jgi:hypothetical protein